MDIKAAFFEMSEYRAAGRRNRRRAEGAPALLNSFAVEKKSDLRSDLVSPPRRFASLLVVLFRRRNRERGTPLYAVLFEHHRKIFKLG